MSLESMGSGSIESKAPPTGININLLSPIFCFETKKPKELP